MSESSLASLIFDFCKEKREFQPFSTLYTPKILLQMTNNHLTYFCFSLLSVLLLCSLVLLRHSVLLYGAVVAEGGIQFVQAFSLDEELSLQLLQIFSS